MFVLDTNTLIYFFRGQGEVKSNLLSHAPQDIAVPTIVVYELFVGIEKSPFSEKRSKQLHQLINTINLLPFDLSSSIHAAGIRAHLEALGQKIGPIDTLIAATARANRGILVTRNTREFIRVPDLAIENWYDQTTHY